MKNFLISFHLFLFAWLLLNGSVAPEYLVTGLMVSAILGGWSTLRFPVFKNMNLTPKAFFAFFILSHLFIFELIKSNIDVTKRVLSPSLPINPGIIAVKTKLTDPVARLILASAITLTPGTLTLDTYGDTFYIHWIDAGNENADKNSIDIVRKFEKYLEVIYG